MGKRIFVIGNGFDLGHGLKTNFEDFIETNSQVLNRKYADLKNGKNSWSEIETNYKSKLNTFISKLDIPFLVDDEMSSIIDAYGLNKYGDVNYHGYDNEMFNSLIDEIDIWVKLLCDFEREFAGYLRALYNDYNIRNNFFPKEKIKVILESANEILSFNYTNTVEQLYGIDDVIHIHGNINKKIFLGCDTIDRMNEVFVDGEFPSMGSFEKSKFGLQEMMAYYEEDENHKLHPKGSYVRFFNEIMTSVKDSADKLKELLRIKSKNCLPFRQEIIEKLKNEHYDEVVILGHSLSEVDNVVFEAINNDAHFVCYYYDKEDYIRKRKVAKQFKWQCDLQLSKELYI
ncbi:MAG: bacteriophage abortive infection AbiH family protein [Clostridia bacterium]|nr:bacteriophage abortive infection AbiH family protein [Clostridia bacterium]